MFVESVPDSTKDTLLKVVQKNILTGTTVVCDMWKTYDFLDKESYLHLSLSHKVHFVDPHTDADTNLIERKWRDIRSMVQEMRP